MRQRVTIRPIGATTRTTSRSRRGLPITSERVYEGDFEIEVEELDSFVQVVLMGPSANPYAWTYRDPSGQLEVGDVVEVPYGYDDRPVLAKVEALGRGTWRGAVKDVAATLIRAEL